MLRAKKEGYFIRLFFISTESPTINAARIAGRVIEGNFKIHEVHTLISKYIDRTYVYDNSIDDKEAALLFRKVDGRIFKTYQEPIPNWAKCIYES
jgi:predicted ABC-type ATPase